MEGGGGGGLIWWDGGVFLFEFSFVEGKCVLSIWWKFVRGWFMSFFLSFLGRDLLLFFEIEDQ